eukprot:jgi/Ulvmu1/494/UM001_0502.1
MPALQTQHVHLAPPHRPYLTYKRPSAPTLRRNSQSHVCTSVFQDAWSTANSLDAQTLAQVWAPQLFAVSLFPYLAFLYYLNKGREASGLPKVTFIGFCFLLVFVFATIPAGIVSKVKYGTSLSNVDLLHGTSESLLTVTNLLIVAGLRQGIMQVEQGKKAGDQAADRATAGAAADEDVAAGK